MLLVGLALGRWWAIPLAGALWVGLVVCTVSIGAGDLIVAAVLGAANAAVGLVARRAAVRSARFLGRLVRFARAA